MAGESTSRVPGRIRISASPHAIAAAFAAIADLEPVAWCEQGIECAPLAGGRDPADQAPRLAALGLPWVEVAGASPPLPFPAAVGGGVYRRSPGHASAPDGVPEIILTAGEGFGLAEHPTTGMCLDLLALLPDGPALDAGCGSGTLALAWARLGRGDVLAVDLDPRAVAQTAASADASGLAGRIVCRRSAFEQLDPHEIADRVVLSNAPRQAQDALLAVAGDPVPPAIVLSGLDAAGMDAVAGRWAARGLALRAQESTGRWQAAALVRA